MSIGASVPISTRAWLSCTRRAAMSNEFCAASTDWIAYDQVPVRVPHVRLRRRGRRAERDLVVLLRETARLQRGARRVDLESAPQRLREVRREARS